MTEAGALGLEDKVAIVTGAGSRASGVGNGRAAAVLLARAGARVGLIDAVEESITETAEMIAEDDGEYLVVPADVSVPRACEAAVETVVGEWGQLDVLVNNVGVAGPPGTVVEVEIDAWEECLRTNVTSMMLMSRFAIPHLRERGGSIINMSSIAGLVGAVPMVAYATTKGAVNSLTRTMASQHGPEGIRVNAIAPGFVYTPMVSAHGLSDEDREQRRAAAPLRTEGTGWDVGHAVVYLASERARWVTGTILPVDAGLTAAGIGVTSSASVDSATADH